MKPILKFYLIIGLIMVIAVMAIAIPNPLFIAGFFKVNKNLASSYFIGFLYATLLLSNPVLTYFAIKTNDREMKITTLITNTVFWGYNIYGLLVLIGFMNEHPIMTKWILNITKFFNS